MSAGGSPGVIDRVRYVVGGNLMIFVAVCLLLTVGGATVAYGAHTGPDTRTEQQVVATWSTDGGFEHGAVVQRDSMAFDEDDVVQNRSVYFDRVTPILNGSYVLEHRGDAEAASFDTNLTLLVRAVEEADAGERVLWEVSEDLGDGESTDLAPGERHSVPFEVNVTERAVTAVEIQEELESSLGRTEILLVAETRTDATLGGEPVGHLRRDRLPISASDRSYRVAQPSGDEQSESVSRPVEIPVEPDPVREYGSILALIAGLVGAAGLVAFERTDRLALSPVTSARIEHGKTRDSFGEWISEGRVPPVEDGERVIDVDSLEDLVDVAIDSDRRVIEDARSGEFVVFDGSTRYSFRPDVGGDSRADPLADVESVRPADPSGDGTGDAVEQSGESPVESGEGDDSDR